VDESASEFDPKEFADQLQQNAENEKEKQRVKLLE
jgi:hypothetical protein